jgi:hypothetical protein
MNEFQRLEEIDLRAMDSFDSQGASDTTMMLF